MSNIAEASLFFGAFISLIAYGAGMMLKKKFKSALLNPLLIAIILTMIVVKGLKIDYEDYNASAKYLSYLLTPATICLAVPLYEQFALLKKNYKAILLGILSGVIASLFGIWLMAWAMQLDHAAYVTLLPKSITTAIGMGVSEELGGHVSITVAVIIITGVLGNIIGETVCKIFKIKDPVAKGVAMGTSAHAIGTSRAMEMGEVEGAMSSLSIVVAGILTVIGAGFCAGLL